MPAVDPNLGTGVNPGCGCGQTTPGPIWLGALGLLLLAAAGEVGTSHFHGFDARGVERVEELVEILLVIEDVGGDPHSASSGGGDDAGFNSARTASFGSPSTRWCRCR